MSSHIHVGSSLEMTGFSRFSAASCSLELRSAQNCALCYTQAAGAGARIVQALRSGIVILVLPPMLICIGLAVMTYKKRNQFNEE